jgi:DNA-binding beta-propeller fold protein YncE
MTKLRLAVTIGLAMICLAIASPAQGSTGGWERAWGHDVISGNAEIGFEICTVALSCQAGAEGGLAGQVSEPTGAAVDSAGDVYVVESGRISKFDSSGNFLRAWGKDVVSAGPGDTGTGFEICVAANGDTCKQGVPGTLGGELLTPRAVALDAAGGVYATDGSNHRIEKYDSSGNFLLTWGKDVALAGPGNTGTGFEVCVAASGDTCQSAAEGDLGGEMRSLDGLGVASTGEVYVADEINDRIQKFIDVPPPPPSGGSGGAAQPPAATGLRAAALKKCKKKRPGPKRRKCKKKAKRLPV